MSGSNPVSSWLTGSVTPPNTVIPFYVCWLVQTRSPVDWGESEFPVQWDVCCVSWQEHPPLGTKVSGTADKFALSALGL